MENIDSINTLGLTRLQHFIVEGDIVTVRALIEAKANPNIQSLGNQNALHFACCYNNRSNQIDQVIILKLLLENKANPFICNEHSRTPFDYACTNQKSYDVLKTLAYAGCWFNPALEYRNNEEIRLLKKSKEDCDVAVVVLYGVLKKRLKQPRDTTRMIALMVWENRFDYFFE